MTDKSDANNNADIEPDTEPETEPDAKEEAEPDSNPAVNPEIKPDILFISGSPRSRTSVALLDIIDHAARNAGAKTQRFLLSKKNILPCTGCEGCMETGICVLAKQTKNGKFVDDYLELKAALDRVDAVAVISPLYFAGPPAQLKALYDRFQPYWVKHYVLGEELRPKRPAQLFMLGGNSDPHGHEPLAVISRSALSVAGFNLEKVNNFIGFLDPREVPVLPAEEDSEQYTAGQLAGIRKAIVRQKAFEQRARDAGGAFARSVLKKMQAKDAQEQTDARNLEDVQNGADDQHTDTGDKA